MKPILNMLWSLTIRLHLLAQIGFVPGTQPIAPVFEKSDLVCNCFVKSLSPLRAHIDGKCPGPARVRAVVEVRDAYRSRNAVERSIAVEFDQDKACVSGLQHPLREGETALMFLAASSSGIYIWADPYLAVIPFDSLPEIPGPLGLAKLRFALTRILQQGKPDDQVRALQLLNGLDTIDQQALTTVAQASDSKDPRVALSALAVLLKSDTPESVKRLRAYLDGYRGGAEPDALMNIQSDLGKVRDRRALRDIEALSASRFVEIRRGAMAALEEMRSTESAPVLIERLDDPDSIVQQMAIIALAQTFQKYGDYAPGIELFKRNPKKYIDLWKKWWAEEGPKQ